MKKVVALALVMLPLLMFASDYHPFIENDKLLVVFKTGVTAEQKQQVFRQVNYIGDFVHYPSPAISVCAVSNKEAAEHYLKANALVDFVSFFIADGKGNRAGVLNTFFVKLKDDAFLPQLTAGLGRLGINAITKDQYIPNRYICTTNKNIQANTIEIAELLAKNAWCEYVAPDYLFFPIACSNDALYPRQWAINNTGSAVQGNGLADADMDVDSAWTITTGAPSIKISIIDSGVDTLHADLMPNLLPGKDAVGDSTDGYPSPEFDEDGHGTCCAGIVAAVKDNNQGIAGIAPSCKVIPVRSFFYATIPGSSTVLPISTGNIFSTAISWSWQVSQADILSNSWGLPPDFMAILPNGVTPVNDAIHLAAANARNGKGVPMFFSSGNDNDSTGSLWPGNLLETIAVNATSMCDERKNPDDCSNENWGGNWGGEIDFSAPGVWVPSTDMLGTNGFTNSDYYNFFNGTSAACPNAAGVAALVLSIRPELTAEEVRGILANTADKVTYTYDSTRPYGPWCRQLGYGRINAYRAVQLAQTFVSTSVNDNIEELQVKIFPNPASGYVNIEVKENATYSLFDCTGALITANALIKGVNRIDTIGMTKGVYVIRVQQGGEVVFNKLIIAG